MSYNKRTWANGNIVGAVDLNRMEQGVESGQNGYECTEESTVLTDETVTTTYDSEMQANTGTLAYSQLITADKLRVTFNGTAYECDVDIAEGLSGDFYRYGGIGKDGPDFSEYPFAIVSAPVPEGTTPATNTLFAQSAGTHTVKIEAFSEVVNTTECFEKAVKKFVGYECKEAYIEVLDDTITTKSDGSPNPPYIKTNFLFITADKIKVTFDGTEYECDAVTREVGGKILYYAYGSTEIPNPTFEDYPFRIVSSDESGTRISTKNEGIYDITINALGLVATTSECFDTAARKAVNASGKCVQLSVGYKKNNNPIVPTEINYTQFTNTEAISIAQGQYGTVTLYAIATTNLNMMFAIMNIYVADNGHLPPITSIKVERDPSNNGNVVYKVEMYARDSAISIENGKLILDALTFESPARTTSFCVVGGTCCEDEALK